VLTHFLVEARTQYFIEGDLDIGRKDQGWAFLDKGSAPPVPDEDGLAIMATTTPTAGEDDETYKTLSK
jgi:hypothetical protein